MEKEVSIIELDEDGRVRYKVTKRIPEIGVSETKLFYSKKNALKKFHEWLD